MDKKTTTTTSTTATAPLLSIADEIANLRHGFQKSVQTSRIIPAFAKFFGKYPKKHHRPGKAPVEEPAAVVAPVAAGEEEKTVEQLLREVAVAVKKQKLSFTTFVKLFSVLKFTVSKHSAFKKDKSLNNRFGDAVIVLGSAYLSSHYSKAQTENKIAKLVNLLNFVEDATILSRLEKSLAAGQFAILQLCLAALIARKQQILAETAVFSKLLDEYFIDTKKRDPKALTITPLIAKLINSANLRDIIAPKLILLLKRNEDNIESVISVLSALENNTKTYDTSAWAVDAVLTHLKPYYYSLNGQSNPSKAALSVLQFVKSLPVLQQIVDGIAVILGQTNDEKKRMFVLRIFEGAAIALAHIEGDSKGITSKILQVLTDNAGAVQDINDLADFMRIVDTLIANSASDFSVSADLSNLMKRKIAIQNVNKLIHAALCRIVSSYVRRYSQTRDNLPEVKDLVDAVITNIVQPNLKAPTKLVTNTEPFLAALELTVVAANYAPLSALALPEVKKSLKTVLLSEKTILNKAEFFQKVSQVEANLLFRSLLLITQLPADAASGITSDLAQLVPLSTSLVQLLFGSANKASSLIFTEEVRRGAITNWLALTEVLSQGLFNYLYYKIDVESTVNVESLQHSIRILEQAVSHLSADDVKASVNPDLTIWILHHPLTHANTLKKFEKQLKTLKTAFAEVIPTKTLSNPYLLISDQMIQNKNALNREATRGYAKFLISLNAYDFLAPYTATIEINNYDLKNAKVIEDFERIVIKHSDEFEVQQAANLNILASLGYTVPTPAVAASSAQEVQPKKAGGAAGNKKPANAPAAAAATVESPKLFEPYLPVYRFRTGHSFLDDEELLAKRKEELRERMVHFYRLACEFYTLFSLSSNADVPEYFFRNLNEGFFGVAVQKQTHKTYRVILANILRKYRSQVKNQALFLADFTITIAQREHPSEKMIREFINFQALINSSLNSDETQEAYVIPYIHKLNFHTIKEDGFDLDTKGNALVFYKQLSPKYNDYLLNLYEPFNATINTLAASPICQVLLEKILLIIKREDTSLLFRNILNNVPNAKKCVLSAIINQSATIKYTPSFEEIIKLRIMEIDNNKDVKAYATKILSSITYELNEEEITKFDIVFFVVDHSIENVDKFSELCLEIIKTHPKLHKVIFNKLTDAAEKCYDQQITEEALTFYPKYVMQHIANIQAEELPAIFNLLVQKYCNPTLQMLMDTSLQCGIELINKFGSQQANSIVNIFDKYLKSTNPDDANKQLSAIVFLGVCAPFIKNKTLIENVSAKIILLFKNGTENLQKSLAKCLPQLMNFFENAKGLIEKTIQSLPFEPTLAQKKGQAYLIAGLIKGLGVAHIEKLNIFKYIDEDLEVKKDVQQKESILVLVTCFLDVLGRVFEPFIARVMKTLMHFFGETNESIKELALGATKLLMSRLTGYGVKVILPQLLLGLDDTAWRAKFNNIWALGNMAFCSPKQMSQCLPQIVPQLSNCLSDTHPKIREVANSSLTLIGSSIKNPEISEIVDILIQALSDPFDLNKTGLEVLLKTRFTHYIDAPALSLVIPIVDYALTQKREVRPKEDACQVVGSISALIKEPKDIIPYMDILVAGLRNALSDNNNEVRLFASKAIGQVCRTLGQANTEKYFQFIKDILESKSSTSIERSGAAQAQSEIMCTLGIDYFKSQLPYLFEKMGDKMPWVREGYIGIFVFVPVILKDNFNQFIREVLDVTSEYVADEDEKTREIALRVLRILIQNFGETQTQLLTGPVNEGLFSQNWRKRLSSVVLSSEMLEILQRMVRQEQNTMSEDEFVQRREENNLTDRQTLLYENFMAVYILRADEMEHIRLQSSQVWKNFVDNTPRTLKIGLKILFSKLIIAISRAKPVDTIAKTAVYNFCQKYGESFFPQVLKVFKEIIAESSKDLSRLRGSILVLAEYSKNLSGLFLKNYQDELVDIIKVHVYTSDNMFRASVFYALRIISERIGEIGLLKNTLNEVFERIRNCTESDPQFDIYLKIFDQLCQSKSDRIMQYIVPQLFQRPIPSPLIEVITNNSEIIAKVSFKFFTKRSGLELLFDDIFDVASESRRDALIYAMNQLSVSLTEDDSRLFILSIVDKINQYMKTYTQSKKDESELEVVLNVLKFYMINTPIHLKEFNKDLINLVNPFIFEFNCPKIAQHASPIIGSIFSILNRKYFVELLHTFSLSIEDCLAREKYENITEILGFNVGEEPGEVIRPFIELATTCLVYDPVESFQDAIDVLKYIVKFTKLENLKQYNFKITGPLIRVANYHLDRHDKKKILQLFIQIKEKGLQIAAFVPQLTTTYMKLAQEFSNEPEFQKIVASNVRNLVEFAPRPDVVLRDIHSRAKEEVSNNVNKSEVFLQLSYKLIKVNEKHHTGKLFTKTFTEKIFNESLRPNENLSQKATGINAKIIGVMSARAPAAQLESYVKEAVSVLKKPTQAKVAFHHALAVLQLIKRNSAALNGAQVNEVTGLIVPLVEKYDKEHQLVAVEQIQKIAKAKPAFAALIPANLMAIDVKKELAAAAGGDNDGIEDVDIESENDEDNLSDGGSIEEDETFNFNVE